MAFPQQFMDELLRRNDIVDVVSSYVSLQRKGSNYFGLCPFHNEKTGSFSVSPDKQIYHCFGCKHGGGAINFIMEMEGLSFPDAVHFLAKRTNLEVPEDEGNREYLQRRQRLIQLNRDAARWFYHNLQQPEGASAAAYMEKRRIGLKVATDFGLGFAPDSWDGLLTAMLQKGYHKSELLAAGLAVQNENGRIYDKFRNRLIFPVIDVRGDVVAFGGRVLGQGEPKYLNSPETELYSKRRNLYGINLAKKTKRPNIILCEGNVDVITLHQAGFDNAVASMGTALTKEQVSILRRYTKELVLCYDNDEAGQAATQKAITLLENSEFKVRVLTLPKILVDGVYGKQDVDDYIKRYGGDAFAALLDGSENQMEFRMDALASKYDLMQEQGKLDYSKAVIDLISGVNNAVERELYADRAAERLGISKGALLLEIDRGVGKRRGAERRELQKENLNASQLRQPVSRAIRYSDVHSAMAEEGIVRLLFQDPTLADKCAPLSAEQFSSPLLGQVYRMQCEAYREGRRLVLDELTEFLPEGGVSHIAGVLQKPERLALADKSLVDYRNIIMVAAEKREESSTEDALAAATRRFKKKKNTEEQ